MRKHTRHHWTRVQKRSLLYFLLCIVCIIGVQFLLPIAKEPSLLINTQAVEINMALAELTQIKITDSLSKLPQKKAFNPNFINEYQLKAFGLSTEVMNKVEAYRAEGKWINSIKDFQTITGISDSLLEEVKAYLKFPDFVNQKKQNSFKAQEKIVQTDLNQADLSALMEVSGIGEVLANRIIEWRDKLGGFASIAQLKHVYGLNDYAKGNLLKHFYIKETEVKPRFNINVTTASDLATVPGLNFDLAKKIWEFCQLREGVDDISELNKIDGLTEYKLDLIRIYLYVD